MNPGRERLLALMGQAREIGDQIKGEASRFAHIAGVGATPAVAAFNLFETPEPLARRMASLAAGRAGAWLEPSAGLGRLYRAARQQHAGPMALVDNAPGCAAELRRVAGNDSAACVFERDFLECSAADLGAPDGFGVVIMNPPFKQGRDVAHIKHALDLLAPQGLIVALCYNGTRQRQELQPMASTWEVIRGAFVTEGTNAEVALLTIDTRQESHQ